MAVAPQARLARPTSIWKLFLVPRSQPIRAASERWNTECRTNDSSPANPTASRVAILSDGGSECTVYMPTTMPTAPTT